MDPTIEIKARLPIEELVGQYCQLQKKGRNFVSLCPFHNDTRPSFLVSPDKGIAYCFACQSGGDVFSFYQAIEGVDFRQALKDLAEKAGVTLEVHTSGPSIKKDEKDRLRECLDASLSFYREAYAQSEKAQQYIQSRGVPPDQVEKFEIGIAPDSFSATYDHLLKAGFSRSEIVAAGMGIQRDLKEEKIYDRFRHRLMFPIRDHQGKLSGFGGRALGDTDAKYINSAESPLYHKSSILYGMDHAKECMRETKKATLVEGYFDVLACHKVGVCNAVAASGTALTQQHAKLLKRYVETVVLCLDQDRAGQDAAERAYHVCMSEGLQVHAIVLPDKDPDETAQATPDLLQQLLSDGGKPYFEVVLDQVQQKDILSGDGKREALKTLLPLLDAMVSSVVRNHYLTAVANVLGTTEAALKEDLERTSSEKIVQPPAPSEPSGKKALEFSRLEITLGLFMTYPVHLSLLQELIKPDEGFSHALYEALQNVPESVTTITVDMLDVPAEFLERISLLNLYCEHHGLSEWTDKVALREIRNNCQQANKDLLQKKQKEISHKLLEARRSGKTEDEAKLNTQYLELLKLAQMAQ